ncbi:hypothetical protein Mapa_010589 [Marchantia paleacea]|nr:hypothetical protein Mapa_010589 [Marchantia paleacea]
MMHTKWHRQRSNLRTTLAAGAALLLAMIRCTYGTVVVTAPLILETYLRDCDMDGNSIDCWPTNLNASCCSPIYLLPKDTLVHVLCHVNSEIVSRVPVWQWVCPAPRSNNLRCGYMSDSRLDCNNQICPSAPCPWPFEGRIPATASANPITNH